MKNQGYSYTNAILVHFSPHIICKYILSPTQLFSLAGIYYLFPILIIGQTSKAQWCQATCPRHIVVKWRVQDSNLGLYSS